MLVKLKLGKKKLKRIYLQKPCADTGCSLEDLSGAIKNWDRERERERVKEYMHAARLDDDDDIYIYIYIYICVCVCVCKLLI